MSELDDLFHEYPTRMTVSQLSEVLGVKSTTVYKWLSEGVIPAYRIGSGWLILRDEVKAAIAANRTGPRPPEES